MKYPVPAVPGVCYIYMTRIMYLENIVQVISSKISRKKKKKMHLIPNDFDNLIDIRALRMRLIRANANGENNNNTTRTASAFIERGIPMYNGNHGNVYYYYFSSPYVRV